MTEKSLPVLRFAPSPNGLLHLGHAYSALLTAATARQLGGTLLLRIEDIDRQRSKAEFDAAIAEDLHWLGLSWPEPVWRQSQRFPVYMAAAAQLRQDGLLYPCFCSRREVAAGAAGHDPDGAPLYGGTCRHLSAETVAARLAEGGPVQWRLRMERALSRAGDLTIGEMPFADNGFATDATMLRAADPGAWGDAVLVRKDTPTSYQLSVVIDDAAQQVTHVTRGMDLWAATDLQVLLQRLLGLPTPIYGHHPLVRDASERKLAKSRGSPSLRGLREAGWTPAGVRQRLGLPEA